MYLAVVILMYVNVMVHVLIEMPQNDLGLNVYHY